METTNQHTSVCGKLSRACRVGCKNI